LFVATDELFGIEPTTGQISGSKITLQWLRWRDAAKIWGCQHGVGANQLRAGAGDATRHRLNR
jgi:hypothetical protein